MQSLLRRLVDFFEYCDIDMSELLLSCLFTAIGICIRNLSTFSKSSELYNYTILVILLDFIGWYLIFIGFIGVLYS